MTYFTEYNSYLGTLTIIATTTALIGLYIQGQKYYPDLSQHHQISPDDSPVLTSAAAWLDLYFSGKNPSISTLPLSPQGTHFRQQVWRHLCNIPYGQTTTYGAIAKAIAAENNITRMSPQAIGGAVGHNPISIIIPCHRVVGADNTLTGYAAGTDIKLRLLTLEGADTSKFSQ
ncbi:MAG: methylated-DNA--[protein]-cysteine S-methyltransferase [Oscillospiraceae bacterium]|nr:methylated-DNA--[protein]-cysteine S-methyltransferase [Oscillospiraceae bacterium]